MTFDLNNMAIIGLIKRNIHEEHEEREGDTCKNYLRDIKIAELKTYAAISNAHLSRAWKRVKLSGSCLSTINGFGSTQLSDILMSYRCSDICLTK